MDIIDGILGLIRKGFEVSHTWVLGSGYSVEKERMDNVQRLRNLGEEAIAKFPATVVPNAPIITYCNFGLQHIAHGMGCDDFNGLNAKQIIEKAKELCIIGKGWREEDIWSKATDHAMKGGFSFMGIEPPPGELHGHVAAVAPLPMQRSGSWGIDVPILFNVGKPPNGEKLVSACFLESEIPEIRCFLYGDP